MAEAPTPRTSLTPEEKFKLITQDLDDGSTDRSKTGEVLGADRLKKVLEERDAVAYWGTAPTGRPHLGYFVPLAKIADFLSAGVEVKVLLADVHAFLDNLKAPISLVDRRVDYYRLLLTAVFRSLHLPLHLVTFVVGSSYQYSQDYNLDQFKLTAITSGRDARKAGAEVVKQVDSPLLSGMLYPLLQALDEEYLKVDFQFGGNDQRKIFTYAELYLPKLGYSKRAHLMNPMVPGLAGGKMSSSDPNSKIDFLDGPSVVSSKIAAAHCVKGAPKDNGILAFVRRVILPIGELKRSQGRAAERTWAATDECVFSVGEKNFGTANELDEAWEAGSINEGDLKDAVAAAINALLEPIQRDLEHDEEFKQAELAAYPDVIGEEDIKVEKEEVVPSLLPPSNLSPAEKYALIRRDLTEVLGEDRLKEVLETRDAVVYWETAPARPTLQSFVALTKIFDLLNAGVHVKVLLDNVHGFYDSEGKTVPNIDHRADHCRLILTALLRSLALPLDRISYVLGSSFQLTHSYNLDHYKLAATTVERDSSDVYPEVEGVVDPNAAKKADDKLRKLLHPLLQTVNEQYMNVDARLGSSSDLSLFKFVESHISTLGYTSPSHLLHPTAPLLVPIDFLDSPSDIKKKLKAAYCAEGDVVNNAILPLVRHILVPVGTLLQSQSRSEVRTWAETPESVLTIHGDPNHGGVTRHFSSIEELEKAFEGKEVHPGDLKSAVTAALISLLAPLQLDLSSDAEFKKVEQEAYPPIVKAVKVVKATKKMTPEQEAKKAEVEAMRALQKAEKEKK